MGEFSTEDLAILNSKNGIKKLLDRDNPNVKKALKDLKYEDELEGLQVELVKLQHWVKENKKRVCIIFEGRDAAGKGGSIQRFTANLPPRDIRVVALPKPTEVEQGQWYFQRYAKHLPNPGEIVFFDRSWYNRAVVEPVMGFCDDVQYKRFMRQVPEFEHMLYEDGIVLIKFWFDITKEEQQERFADRRKSLLKQWKISPVDEKAQKLWGSYTEYKDKMMVGTHTSYSPWIIVEANSKKKARLESIRYVLSQIDYEGKDKKIDLTPDPKVVMRYG